MEKYSKAIDSDKELIDYLTECYEVTEPRATQLLVTYKAIIDEGKSMGSYVWYVGDRVASEAGLEMIPEINEEDVAYENEDYT